MGNLEYSFDNILKSYIDTGIPLPEYQLNLISSNKNMVKTYVRKRAIALKKTGFGETLLSNKELELFRKYDKKIYDDYMNYISNLKELYLYGKNLKTLPESIGYFKNLDWLVLGENWLTSLPESIGNLKNLGVLWLAENQLKSLPKSIGNLTNLKELYLYNNPISDEEKERIKKLLPNTKIYFKNIF